jgi:hypothetical protein
VANHRRTDNSDFTRSADHQPPIVLARLPRIGAEQPTATATRQNQTIPEPEHIPQLDLQEDVARQTRLHIADTVYDDAIPNTRHFADHSHETDPNTPASASRVSPQAASQRRPSDDSRAPRTDDQPTTLSEKLFRLHAQVSPHAGLIVALALIASAGLLYWMIVGPAQLPLPQYDYGTEFTDGGLGSISSYRPEFVAEAPQPVAATAPVVSPEPVTSPQDDDLWEEVVLPTPSRDESLREDVESVESSPAVKPTSLQKLPTAVESPFPQTATPEPLDFSRLHPIQTSPTNSDSPQSFPEVAGRPSTMSTR